ncbi:DNA-binding protein [Thermococci archaeon]|nr:MAG: DNA-binding protein [Thermococci archaeon]
MFSEGRIYMFRVPEGEEFIRYMHEFLEREGIEVGIVNAIGTLKDPKIGYFLEGEKRYKVIELRGTYEIASLIGNISLKDGRPFLHAHVVLGNSEGKAFGGHLIEGRVLVAEVFVLELKGERLERKMTEKGLALWP